MQKDLFGNNAFKSLLQIKREKWEKKRLEKLENEDPLRYCLGKRTSDKKYSKFIDDLAFKRVAKYEEEFYDFYKIIMFVARVLG